MSTTTTTLRAAVAAMAVLFCFGVFGAAAHAEGEAEQKLSGPYTHGNLTIYLIHGPSTLKEEYLTLEEAMAAGTVKVHETGDVNELAIENVGQRPVFIQSGDIVKGGKQDRCIGTDFTLAPDSGKVKIAAFCVERGRWSRRGEESPALFSASSDAISGKALKLAGNANYGAGGGQQKVWEEVRTNQEKLSRNVAAQVAAPASPSSFQLTLENENVREAVENYVQKLASAPDGKDDAIGYAAVINGKVNCADVYGSHELFMKLWPRLLKSVATEAAAESTADQAEVEAVPAEEVEAALRVAEDGKRTENEVTESIGVVTIETPRNITFESRADGEDGFLRRSTLTKD